MKPVVLHTQKGSLLIPMIFLVVAVSVLVTTVVYLTINQSTTITYESKRLDAFYTAKAGIERATYSLLTYTLADQVSCSNIASNFTNVDFGNGQFSVTATLYQPTSTALSATITDSSVIIPVNSIGGYASKGSIAIDSETIRYNQTATLAANCGGYSACFLGALRGQAGTTASSHVLGRNVSQKQCSLTSQSGIPNLTSPVASQVITAGVELEAQSSGDGWIVASKHANGNETTINYNGTTWVLVGPSSDIPNKTLYGVYTLPNNTGWMVGESAGADPIILFWNGQVLSSVMPDSTLKKKDLYGVMCVTLNDCWIVGDTATIIHWNGSTWLQASTDASVPSVIYRSVDCTSSSNCWAVGDVNSSLSSIIKWDGSTWTRVSPNSTTNQALYGISCISANNCWAIGNASLITHWDGSSWTKATGAYIGSSVPASVNLRGITCVDGTHCWAVGAANLNKGTILFFNGTVWERVTDDGSLPNQQYNSVSCNNANSCWAVGNDRSIAYFNGTSWSNFTADASIPDVDLTGVGMLRTGTIATGLGGVMYEEIS